MRAACLLLGLWAAGAAPAPESRPDPVLAALEAELERSRGIRLAELEPPYFIQYTLEDVSGYSVTATLGALIREDRPRFRVAGVEVRVGSYEFDNTNYALADLFGRAPAALGVPIEDDEPALRAYFWLATDAAYKGALESMARKRAAVKHLGVFKATPDFWKAEPVTLLEPVSDRGPEATSWPERVRELSSLFRDYPQIDFSQVDYGANRTVSYLVNSEGARIRYVDWVHWLQLRAEAQAPDGMPVRDVRTLVWPQSEDAPAPAEFREATLEVARMADALRRAPQAENYVGPVLVEGIAAPQLLAQLLGRNLAVVRRPVGEPGRTPPVEPSEFEGRLGTRVLPEWMDVVDDPTQTEWRGRRLLGFYRVDMEGVAPKPLVLIERGILRAFLLTRQPVEGQTGSNGRARLPGPFGARSAAISNLFVSASTTLSPAALRERLLEMVRARSKPYGLIIRKLDFPASGGLRELRRLALGASGRASGGRLVSRPLLVWRLRPDGSEELVRGLEFRNLSARLLRDIVAASDESHLFEYLANTAPLSLAGAGGYVAGTSVIAPSLLFEELELERSEEQFPRPPVVPAPPLAARR